jgi:outer membrane receptor protein involved in Fe transport
VLVDNLGPWFGGLQWRRLGPYPINDGTEAPRDPGYSEVNLDLGYKFSQRLKVQLSVYNALNSRAYSAAYFYQSRLTPSDVPPDCDTANRATCYQVRPMDPRSARLSITAQF